MKLYAKAYDSTDILFGGTVESFLKECGYSENEINIIKRPYNKLIVLSDGCILYRILVSKAMLGRGYLYVCTASPKFFTSKMNTTKLYNLLMLTNSICCLNVKE